MSNKTAASSFKVKTDNDMAFILNTFLASRNMSQRELARISGITQAQICAICAGKQSPSVKTLERIAEALEVDITDLFTRDNVKTIVCPHCGKEIKVKVETKNNVKIIK